MRGSAVEHGKHPLVDQFDAMEKALRDQNPGVLSVLEIYGGYEEALRQVDAYFATVNQAPIATTSNSSVDPG